MKIKTSELSGKALDWAVAQCLTGGELFQLGRVAHAVILHCVGGTIAPYFVGNGSVKCAFEPSTNWSQGGPIIELEKISVEWHAGRLLWRSVPGVAGTVHYGETPLIAAMRCFVASKLGNMFMCRMN